MSGEARPIVELRVGAHLYGTETLQSDLDTKRVVLPSARDILLQRAGKAAGQARTAGRAPAKCAGEEDVESFSLQRFLDLLVSGQPLAVEMLFAPDALMLSAPDPIWREIQVIGPALLTRGAAVFARYARRQADQYGNKGDRAASARHVLSVLTQAEKVKGSRTRLNDITAELDTLVATLPHVEHVEIPLQSGRVIRHLDVCGRKAAYNITIGEARDMVSRLVAGYGERAQEASQQNGVDWKALSHAVRVGREAIELLATGRLVFPLSCAPHLLAIKLGQVAYAEVAAEIETLLEALEKAAESSFLPDHACSAAAESLIVRSYAAQVHAARFGS